MNNKMAQYMQSFKNVYFSELDGTEKGESILSVKARVLGLSESECKLQTQVYIDNYQKYKSIVSDFDIKSSTSDKLYAREVALIIRELLENLELTEEDIKQFENREKLAATVSLERRFYDVIGKECNSTWNFENIYWFELPEEYLKDEYYILANSKKHKIDINAKELVRNYKLTDCDDSVVLELSFSLLNDTFISNYSGCGKLYVNETYSKPLKEVDFRLVFEGEFYAGKPWSGMYYDSFFGNIEYIEGKRKVNPIMINEDDVLFLNEHQFTCRPDDIGAREWIVWFALDKIKRALVREGFEVYNPANGDNTTVVRFKNQDFKIKPVYPRTKGNRFSLEENNYFFRVNELQTPKAQAFALILPVLSNEFKGVESSELYDSRHYLGVIIHFALCDLIIYLFNRQKGETRFEVEALDYWINDEIKTIEKSAPPITEPKTEVVYDFSLKCPKCGSSNLSSGKKGFSLGKSLLGGFALGPVGLLGGLHGSNANNATCLDCGHKWSP